MVSVTLEGLWMVSGRIFDFQFFVKFDRSGPAKIFSFWTFTEHISYASKKLLIKQKTLSTWCVLLWKGHNHNSTHKNCKRLLVGVTLIQVPWYHKLQLSQPIPILCLLSLITIHSSTDSTKIQTAWCLSWFEVSLKPSWSLQPWQLLWINCLVWLI